MPGQRDECVLGQVMALFEVLLPRIMTVGSGPFALPTMDSHENGRYPWCCGSILSVYYERCVRCCSTLA